MLYDVFIIVTLPLVWVLLNVFSFIIIFLHELSHAIPPLLLKKKTAIYIGNYGDNSHPKLNFGRLTIYIKPKFSYFKNNGLCLYKADLPFKWRLTSLFAGPVAIVIIACLLLSYMIFSDTNIYMIAVVAVAFITTLINLAVNLFPRKIKVKGHQRLFYSDGYQIILLLENKHNYQNILTAGKYYDEGDFMNALNYLKKVDDKYMDESVFSLMLSCYINLKNYGLAKKLNKKYELTSWYELISADEYSLLADADIHLKHYNQALINLDKSLALNPNQFKSRYNRGSVYNLLENYTSAKDDLTKAVYVDENSSYAYSGLALSNFKLGRTGEALAYAEKALILDENNANAYFIKGMYQFEKEKFKLALEDFEKAKGLDPKISLFNEYIAKSKLYTTDDKPSKPKTKRKIKPK